MKHWKRLFYYLAINVLVSACTILAVLTLWDRAHNSGASPLLPGSLQLSTPDEATSTPESAISQVALEGPSATPAYIVHQVVSGDTFESIAEQYGVNVDTLIALNGFTKNQPLGEGEGLLIPITPTPNTAPGVAIANVIGAGDLASERVVIQQKGAGDLLLAGWQLSDENGDVFTFPALELTQDGFEVQIYTRTGTNSADILYWGLDQPVWGTGEKVTLQDANGEEQATFLVP